MLTAQLQYNYYWVLVLLLLSLPLPLPSSKFKCGTRQLKPPQTATTTITITIFNSCLTTTSYQSIFAEKWTFGNSLSTRFYSRMVVMSPNQHCQSTEQFGICHRPTKFTTGQQPWEVQVYDHGTWCTLGPTNCSCRCTPDRCSDRRSLASRRTTLTESQSVLHNTATSF